MDFRWSLADSYDRAPKPARRERSRSTTLTAAAVAAGVASMPIAANAGSFSTSLSNFPQEGQTSRFGVGDGYDPVHLEQSGCNQQQIQSDLRRDITLAPDKSYGVVNFTNCVDYTQGWAWNITDHQTGQFFFQFWWPGASNTTLTTKSTKAWWDGSAKP
ncbi:hypothetical protein Ga0074812_104337 [Parafrankia irregularis]|uniref:Uncharacterized protein n=1 Tax=Parafrankia irregularis TaxID=795642 RepID=A0A0S4QK96_9ACTN|nr:hypothetical protein [Parafrankia irregularis]MBE3203873.1 hypothetical protein [Parafrankia sp. CH37]CUU55256.1 hypothetical protein Ga0074812_104337 [Parafrankia irregularis]